MLSGRGLCDGLITRPEGFYRLWRVIKTTRKQVNPLNAELNPICHLLALLGCATIVVVSRLRVKINRSNRWATPEATIPLAKIKSRVKWLVSLNKTRGHRKEERETVLEDSSHARCDNPFSLPLVYCISYNIFLSSLCVCNIFFSFLQLSLQPIFCILLQHYI